MSYMVYENRVLKYASVHSVDCIYVKMHDGESIVKPPTVTYHEGFETAAAALALAINTGQEVRICRMCKPPVADLQ